MSIFSWTQGVLKPRPQAPITRKPGPQRPQVAIAVGPEGTEWLAAREEVRKYLTDHHISFYVAEHSTDAEGEIWKHARVHVLPVWDFKGVRQVTENLAKFSTLRCQHIVLWWLPPTVQNGELTSSFDRAKKQMREHFAITHARCAQEVIVAIHNNIPGPLPTSPYFE